MTTIYHYDAATHELRGTGTANESPLEPGVFLIPANATEVAPPAVGANQAAVFNPTAQTWSLVDDFRGTQVFAPDGHSQIPLTALGVALPALAAGEVIQQQADGTLKAVPDSRGKTYYNQSDGQETLAIVGVTLPTPAAGEVIQQQADGSYLAVPDNRGTVYYTAGATADTIVSHTISRIGDTVPAGATTSKPTLPPSSAMVSAELARRLGVGVSVSFGGATFIAQADDTSRGLIDGWVSQAKYEVAQGNGAGATAFRDAANVTHAMTYADVEAFAAQIGAAVQTLIQKSWALKDTSPIPSDYTANTHWA